MILNTGDKYRPAHARPRAADGFVTGYHLQHCRLPGVPRCRVLGCGKLYLPKLPRSPCAAGMPRAQHVDKPVDRELLLAAWYARGAHW
jgi:hypothetical protein